jgi:predicted SprT family Zn-dependent metalloprotease
MPGPDPNTVWFEEYEGRLLATYEPYLWSGNVGNRKARAVAILKRLVWHDWFCRWCGDDLPDWRRADARYCCEGCRKRAARQRRQNRVSEGFSNYIGNI